MINYDYINEFRNLQYLIKKNYSGYKKALDYEINSKILSDSHHLNFSNGYRMRGLNMVGWNIPAQTEYNKEILERLKQIYSKETEKTKQIKEQLRKSNELRNYKPEKKFHEVDKTIIITPTERYAFDYNKFFTRYRRILIDNCEMLFKKYGPYRLWTYYDAQFKRNLQNKTTEYINTRFYSTQEHFAYAIVNMHDVLKAVDKSLKNFEKQIDNFTNSGSGWILVKNIQIALNFIKYRPTTAGEYIETPYFIYDKKCCINVQNKDNKCFMWAILAHLYPVKKDPQRVTKYKKYENELNFNGIDFPVKITDIHKFEKQNKDKIDGINVFELNKNDEIIPCYINKKASSHINLLLLKKKISTIIFLLKISPDY